MIHLERNMQYRALVVFLFSLLLAAAQVRAGEVERWNRVATDAAVAQELDPLNESRIFAYERALRPLPPH